MNSLAFEDHAVRKQRKGHAREGARQKRWSGERKTGEAAEEGRGGRGGWVRGIANLKSKCNSTKKSKERWSFQKTLD